jgi:hypothetical protein
LPGWRVASGIASCHITLNPPSNAEGYGTAENSNATYQQLTTDDSTQIVQYFGHTTPGATPGTPTERTGNPPRHELRVSGLK